MTAEDKQRRIVQIVDRSARCSGSPATFDAAINMRPGADHSQQINAHMKRCRGAPLGETDRDDELQRSRDTGKEIKRCREALVEAASQEAAYRSLSAVEHAELQDEATMVHRAVHPDQEIVPGAPPPRVTDADRDVARALNLLKVTGSTEADKQRSWGMALKFGESVDKLRPSMSADILQRMETAGARCGGCAVRDDDQSPLAYQVARGFGWSAKFMLAETEKVQKAALAAAANDFVAEEQRLITAASAAQIAQPEKRHYNDQCGICFDDLGDSLSECCAAGDSADGGVTVLACKHGYGAACIKLYWNYGGRKCPLCNAPFDLRGSAHSAQHTTSGANTEDDGDGSEAHVYRNVPLQRREWASLDATDDDGDDDGSEAHVYRSLASSVL